MRIIIGQLSINLRSHLLIIDAKNFLKFTALVTEFCITDWGNYIDRYLVKLMYFFIICSNIFIFSKSQILFKSMLNTNKKII